MRHLLGVDPKHSVGKSMHGLLLAVDWFPLNDERAQQDPEGPGVWNGTTGIRRQVAIQDVRQADAVDDVIDEG
jgi:hypothetical protein